MTSNTGKKNIRAAARYQVDTALRYCIAGHNTFEPGRTRNMSAGGALIDVRETLAAGTILLIEMEWPGIYFGKHVLRLFLNAQVVRSDATGTAVKILGHEFRDVVERPRSRVETARAVA